MKTIILVLSALTLFTTRAFTQADGKPNNDLKGDTGKELPLTREGDNFLGQSYNKTLCGLDWVESSKMIATRYTPDPGTGFPCALPITGIPSSYVVDKAFLYWIVSYTAGSSITPVVNLTNPLGATVDYPGDLIGQDEPKCWFDIGTRGFRADVTAAITGNGTYTINNILGNSAADTDGATLLIIYRNLAESWKGTMILNDGMDSYMSPTYKDTLDGFTACEEDTSADIFIIVSDLQNNAGLTFSLIMNGDLGVFPKDFYNFAGLTTTIAAGQTSVNYDLIPGGDCYGVVLNGLYYKTISCGTCDSTLLNVNAYASPISCFGAADANAWATIIGGTPPYSISWSPGGSTNDSLFNLGPGTYFITVTDSTGASETDSIIITEPNVLTVAVNTLNDTICFGSSINIGTTVNGGTIPYSYQWSTGPGDVLASVITSPTSSGYFSVVVTDDNNCTISDSTFITVLTIPAVTSSADTCICEGASATITASGTPSFLWNTGSTSPTITVTPTTNTLYIVSYSNGVCTTSDTTIVCVNPTPSVSINPSDTVCAGTSVTFAAVITSGTTPFNYSWTGLTTGSTTSISIIATTSGTENLFIVDANGCSTSASSFLEVLAVPNITASADACICFGDSLTLNASGTPSYTWSTGQTTSSIQVSPLTNTTYIVSYSNGVCADDDSVFICVNPTPVVIASNDTSIQFQSTVFLSATGTGPFDWNPSNTLNCTPCANPEASPSETTTYIVSTTNAFGCSAQDIVTVSIYYVLIIPNIFTPNGDGMNDTFHILGLPPDSKLAIFNRWGNELYTTDSYLNNWTTETDGVYYYVLKTPDDKSFNGFFHVTGN
jgi:gliding motility-associated-like protein